VPKPDVRVYQARTSAIGTGPRHRAAYKANASEVERSQVTLAGCRLAAFLNNNLK